MVSPRRAWDSFTGVDLVRRDSPRADVPTKCYDVCNEVGVLAQENGKNPAMCAADSAFQHKLSQCQKCITGRGNECLSDLPENLVPSLQQFVDYCNNVTDPNSIGDLEDNALKIETLVKKNACLSSSLADLQSSLSHQRTGAPSTATSAHSTSSPPAGPSDGSQEKPPSNIARTVVPAVVVPVVAVLVGFTILAYVLWRWRQRLRAKQAGMPDQSAESPEFGGKAELPVDKFRSELDGVATIPGKEECKEMDTNEVAELPAREAVGVEMDASGQRG